MPERTHPCPADIVAAGPLRLDYEPAQKASSTSLFSAALVDSPGSLDIETTTLRFPSAVTPVRVWNPPGWSPSWCQ